MRTTVGQLLINEILPEDLRDYTRVLDKKSIRTLLRLVATQYPQKYNEIASQLSQLGGEGSTAHGREASLTLDSLRLGPEATKLRKGLDKTIDAILNTPGLSPEDRDKRIVMALGRSAEKIRDVNLKEQLKARNPLAMQVNSGARGNPSQFSALNVGDLLVADHRDKEIPVPITHSYSDGLDPVEYWAASYGARKGTVSTKFATPKGGFLGKQLALAAHRLVVTEEDCGTENGIPVDGNDPDNVGALLARKAGTHGAGTVITPKLSKQLGRQKTVVVRSPVTCEAMRGICSKCAGVRERGKFPEVGDNIGVAAAQAIAEPVSQSALNVKHSGGIVGSGPTAAGFDAINQLVQVPKTFQGGAAVAKLDGRVEAIEKAPQGGTFVRVGGERHYVPPGFKTLVKKGDRIEAGDVMSEGLPNPAEVVRYKGIGAGRWHFMNNFRNTLKASKIAASRRNVELLSRGLINHVRIMGLNSVADALPDDLVEFNSITRRYRPRPGARDVALSRATNRFLERPYLQYSIGTRVTPRVAADLKKAGVKNVMSHEDEPPFVPEMVRAMETISYAPDWMTRLGGFHLKKGLLESVHRGRASKEHGESFVPSLARGVEFGKPPASSGAPY
jgi:DNA-directed RNA polymerase subunit beta'